MSRQQFPERLKLTPEEIMVIVRNDTLNGHNSGLVAKYLSGTPLSELMTTDQFTSFIILLQNEVPTLISRGVIISPTETKFTDTDIIKFTASKPYHKLINVDELGNYIEVVFKSEWELSKSMDFRETDLIERGVDIPEDEDWEPNHDLLESGNRYYVRMRWKAYNHYSHWSIFRHIDVGDIIYVKPPTIQIEGGNNNVTTGPTILTSQYQTIGDLGEHFSSDWEILDESGKIKFKNIGDQINKTVITLPAGTLDINSKYITKVRHNATYYKSGFSYLRFTTGASTYLNTIHNLHTPMVTGIRDMGISLIGNGELIITGGLILGHDSKRVSTNKIYKFIPNANNGIGEWEEMGVELNTNRHLHSQSTLPDGRVVIYGGINLQRTGVDTTTIEYLSSLEIYDPNTNTIQSYNDLSVLVGSLYSHTQLTVRTVSSNPAENTVAIIIIGGRNDVVTASNTVHIIGILNTGVDTVFTHRVGNSLRAGRHSHGASLINNNEILVTGGMSHIETFNTTERISLKKLLDLGDITVWDNGPLMISNKRGHNQTTMADGNVLISGGVNNLNNLITQHYILNVSNGVISGWSRLLVPLINRVGAAQLMFANGNIITMGGEVNNNLLTNVQLYK